MRSGVLSGFDPGVLSQNEECPNSIWGRETKGYDAFAGARVMVEHLKRSLDGLESPGCPNCHLDMRWYRSELDKTAPRIVSHFFMCPNCNRIGTTKAATPNIDEPPPPSKLSRPRHAP